MNKIIKPLQASLLIFSIGVLTACGGGSKDTPPDPNPDPTAAYPPETTLTRIATHSVEKIALGETMTDPEFGSTVTRLTDRINQQDTPLLDRKGNRNSRGNSQPYPKTQAWNSDMSMFRMRYRLYDANTLEELPITNGTNELGALYSINGSLSEMKWSTVFPNVFYGVNGSKFWQGTIDRATNTISYDLIHLFESGNVNYDKFTLGKYEGNIDFNDKYVVFAARKTGKKYLTAIVYDIASDKVRATVDFPQAEWPDQGQVFDWISVSPLGKHILMSSGGKINQYDLDLQEVRQLAPNAGHGDLGVDQNGDEVYVQFEFGVDNGIWIYRLKDGYRIRLLPDKYNGGHVSCRNHQRKGWCYLSTTHTENREVFAVKLDYSGPDNHIVNRFVQTHTSGHGSLANVSPDGRRLLFESDWDDAVVPHWADRDTYHVEYR